MNHTEEKDDKKGLTELRNKPSSGNTEKYKCSNCGCERFVPCTCQKKGEKNSE